MSGSVMLTPTRELIFTRYILCGICYLNLSLLAVTAQPPGATEPELDVGYREARWLPGKDRDRCRVWKCSRAFELLCTRHLLAISGAIL